MKRHPPEEALYQEALSTFEELDPESEKSADLLNNLGLLVWSQGDIHGSISYSEWALVAYRRILPPTFLVSNELSVPGEGEECTMTERSLSSREIAHAAIEELKKRLAELGFVRKGKHGMARIFSQGLQIVEFDPPGNWRTDIRVDFGVWFAALEACQTGKPVPWPRKRFPLPGWEHRHAQTELAKLAGFEERYFGVNECRAVGLPRHRLADLVWSHWPAAEGWLTNHSDLAWLTAEMSRKARESLLELHLTHSDFQIPGMGFVTLGEPDLAREMCSLEIAYLQSSTIVEHYGVDLVEGWRAQAETQWARILGGLDERSR